MIDGEVVALDEDGRPSFQLLQNYASTSAPLVYFVFDVMILGGRDVTGEPLTIRRELLETKVLPKLAEPVRYVGLLDAPLPTLIQSVKADGLEGLVAKRLDSRYEPGLQVRRVAEDAGQPRPGVRHRRLHDRQSVRRADLRVLPGREADLRGAHAQRLHARDARAAVQAVQGPRDQGVPVRQPAGEEGGRWGAGLTAKKMADCRWLKPVLVGQFEFVEWTGDNHLRHTKFVGLRDDKDAKTVVRE